MADPAELGLTNLGPIPAGMSFLQATESMVALRRYRINPAHRSGRLTICETCREIWRIAETVPEPQRSQLLLLAGAAFDFGKRMNSRMVDLKLERERQS